MTNRVVVLSLLCVVGAPCEVTNNVVYSNGDNLPGGKSKAASAQECCALCQANKACTSYTFDLADKTAATGAISSSCFLHGGNPNAQPPVQKPGRISGRVRNATSDDDDDDDSSTPTPAAPPLACQGTDDAANFAFCDGSVALESRVADFVRRINDTDKPSILTARDPVPLPALAGTPGYYWGTNCIQSVENGAHGEATPCAGAKCSTKFPSPPGWMASFNRTGMATMAKTMALELRALYNTGHAKGLDCWGPVLNLARDPRWGRCVAAVGGSGCARTFIFLLRPHIARCLPLVNLLFFCCLHSISSTARKEWRGRHGRSVPYESVCSHVDPRFPIWRTAW